MSFYNDASLVFLPSGGAGKDGKAYSMKPVPEYGSELVTNGDFATDSDWIKGTGWTISGGTANCDGTQTGNTLLYQNIGHSSNTLYRLQFTISNYVSGTIDFALDNPFFGAANSNGTFVFDITPSSVGNFIVRADENFVGSIDNVSVKEITTSGDFTFSRGSNLTATRVDSNGLIEKGRENLLKQSNQFDTTWSDELLGSIVSGQSGYDGTNDAWLLNKGEYQYRRILQTLSPSVSGIWTLSVYAKEGTTSIMNLRDMTNAYRVEFDLSGSGSVSAAFGNISSKIESVGNGWFRCSATFNVTSSSVGIYVGWNDSTASNIYIQDAQLEIGLAATEYIESGATTGKAGILEHSPRFDYSGGASCPSLILEGSRTQLIPQTEYFNFSGYTTFNSTINDNATTSPEGLINAAEIAGDGSTGQVFFRENLSVPSVGNYTFSLFAKYKNNSDATNLMLDISSFGDGNGTCFFDIENGVKGTESGVTGNIEDYGNGWYRCSITTNITDGTDLFGRLQFYAANSSEGLSFSPNNANADLYIYGMQVEQGSYPTSYIPNHSGTTGSISTRDADEATLTYSNNFNDITIFTEVNSLDVIRDGSSQNIHIGNDYSQGGAFFLRRSSNTSPKRLTAFFKNNDNSDVFSSYELPIDDSKVAFKYNSTSNACKLFVNGSEVRSATATDITEFDTFRLNGDGGKFNSKQLVVFNTELSDDDCEALTAL